MYMKNCDNLVMPKGHIYDAGGLIEILRESGLIKSPASGKN